MLSALSEKVIATGGVAPLRERNVDLMKQNGIVVYLKRDIEKLSTEGRPLSAGGKERLYKLYDERHEIYEKASDVIIETHEDVDECAERLVEMIEEKISQLF